MSNNLTKRDIVLKIFTDKGYPQKHIRDSVQMTLDAISEALLAGDNVKISSFGSFMLREKGLRIGRNPKTGVEVPIQPRTVLTFRPSQLLREAINTKS